MADIRNRDTRHHNGSVKHKQSSHSYIKRSIKKNASNRNNILSSEDSESDSSSSTSSSSSSSSSNSTDTSSDSSSNRSRSAIESNSSKCPLSEDQMSCISDNGDESSQLLIKNECDPVIEDSKI